MPLKVLITGGAGFVGSHLADALVERGYNVFLFDNLDPQVHGKEQDVPKYLNSKATFIKGDMRNRTQLKKALDGVDAVFHHAAAVGVGQSMYQIRRYVDVNDLGTANLLDILANNKHSVRKLIVASSMSIYGEGAYECPDCGAVYPQLRSEEQLSLGDWEMACPVCRQEATPIATSEDKPLSPRSIYAITKKNQEDMCLMIGKVYNIPTVGLRYFNIYGPRQSLSNPYTGVCAIFSSRTKNSQPLLVYEDGLQTRDFVHVKDVVRATLLALDKSEADHQVFNVGTGRAVSILEIANTLVDLYKSNVKPQIVNKFRVGDIRHCYADISKIQSLGFKPRIALEEGMKDLVEWGMQAEAEDKAELAQTELSERGLITGQS